MRIAARLAYFVLGAYVGLRVGLYAGENLGYVRGYTVGGFRAVRAYRGLAKWEAGF